MADKTLRRQRIRLELETATSTDPGFQHCFELALYCGPSREVVCRYRKNSAFYPCAPFQKWVETQNGEIQFWNVMTALSRFEEALHSCVDCPYHETDWMTLLHRRFPRDRLLDNLLALSHGAVLWSFQVEMLVTICTGCAGRASELVRSMNAKRTEAWEKAGNLRLPTGISVSEVLSERGVVSQCYPKPNLAAATRIYCVIRGVFP